MSMHERSLLNLWSLHGISPHTDVLRVVSVLWL